MCGMTMTSVSVCFQGIPGLDGMTSVSVCFQGIPGLDGMKGAVGYTGLKGERGDPGLPVSWENPPLPPSLSGVFPKTSVSFVHVCVNFPLCVV